jgi:Flp pilus assembly protein protease CpaA
MADKIAFLGLCAFLMTAAILDVRTGKVFNWLTYPAMGVSLFFWTVMGATGHGLPGQHGEVLSGLDGAANSFTWSALGLAAGILPFALLFSMGGLHGGDVKVMGVVGALSARWDFVLYTTVYSLVVAVLIAAVIMIRKGIVIKILKRIMVTAISAAAGVKTDLSNDTERIPFAVAVFGGGVLAGVEYMLKVVTFPWTVR